MPEFKAPVHAGVPIKEYETWLYQVTAQAGLDITDPLIAAQLDAHLSPTASATRSKNDIDLGALYARWKGRNPAGAAKQEQVLSNAKGYAEKILREDCGAEFLEERFRLLRDVGSAAELLASVRRWLELYIWKTYLPEHPLRQHVLLDHEAFVTAMWIEGTPSLADVATKLIENFLISKGTVPQAAPQTEPLPHCLEADAMQRIDDSDAAALKECHRRAANNLSLGQLGQSATLRYLRRAADYLRIMAMSMWRARLNECLAACPGEINDNGPLMSHLRVEVLNTTHDVWSDFNADLKDAIIRRDPLQGPGCVLAMAQQSSPMQQLSVSFTLAVLKTFHEELDAYRRKADEQIAKGSSGRVTDSAPSSAVQDAPSMSRRKSGPQTDLESAGRTAAIVLAIGIWKERLDDACEQLDEAVVKTPNGPIDTGSRRETVGLLTISLQH